jgi:hypothetical protein
MICIYLSWIDNHEQVGEREREGRGGKKHAKARAAVDEISKHTTAKYDPSSFESLQHQPASQPSSQPAA